MHLPPPLDQTLAQLGAAMVAAQRPWWVIAGAACALHGLDAAAVSDVDVLIDPADVAPLFMTLGLEVAPGLADARFRSDSFARWTAPPLPVDIFAGFQVLTAGTWHTIKLSTRQKMDHRSGPLYIPERRELIELLRQFGRDKDLVRAAALTASDPSPSRSGSA